MRMALAVYNFLGRFIHFHDWQLNGTYYTFEGVKKVQRCKTCGAERVV